MTLSTKAKQLIAELTNGSPKMGDLKKLGKEIKKDHALSMELWVGSPGTELEFAL